jgi:hypothetical protein
MKRTLLEPPTGIFLALAIVLQGIGLVYLSRPGIVVSLQYLLLSLALGVTAQAFWHNRYRWDHHLDMTLVMLAFGGLGMLIGTGIDGALATRKTPTPAPAANQVCHSSRAMTAAAGPAGQTKIPGMAADQVCGPCASTTAVTCSACQPSRVCTGLWSWMTGLMLLGGIPPSWFLTRCAKFARDSWRRWFATHIAGNLGMLAGMIVAGSLAGQTLGRRLGSMPAGHHLAMLGGMLAGMAVGQLLAEAALGVKDKL